MIRALLAGLAVACIAGPALAQSAHHARTYSVVRSEVDVAQRDGATLASWEADAWIGGDDRKLWLKTEGEVHDREVEAAELQALLSVRVSDYWDAQVGVRRDFEPVDATHLVLGVQGLAPYQFETEAALFLSDEGDLSLRASQSLDLLLTQRLVLEPKAGIEASFGDVPEAGTAAGFTRAELSLQLRYEITRKVAPYVAVSYETLLGETGDLAERRGEDRDRTLLRAGLRSWF